MKVREGFQTERYRVRQKGQSTGWTDGIHETDRQGHEQTYRGAGTEQTGRGMDRWTGIQKGKKSAWRDTGQTRRV